jgi:hypothetical protein
MGPYNTSLTKQTNTRPIILIVIVLAVIMMITYLLLRPSKFELLSVEPAPYSQEVPPDSFIVFRFNKKLAPQQKEDFSVTIAPNTDLTWEVQEDRLIINVTELMVDETTYNVSVQNISSTGNDVLDVSSNTFTVLDNTKRGEFLRNLPIEGDGYVIARLSSNTIYAQITKNPVDKKESAIRKLLNDSGITDDLFVIKIEALRSLTGSGAPAIPLPDYPGEAN